MHLSVVIPAYNEERGVAKTLAAVTSYLAETWPTSWEVVVVDDGSADGTAAEVRRFGHPAVRLVEHEQNRGKGQAMRTGAAAATGNHVLLMDADSSTEISELPKLVAALADADLAFGSRGMPGHQITKRQPWYRMALGKLGNLVIQALVLPGVLDSQCGFKLLGPAAVPLMRQLRSTGWGIDVELLALARRRGLRLAEVPIVWRHDERSSITPLSYLRTLIEVLRIAWRLRE